MTEPTQSSFDQTAATEMLSTACKLLTQVSTIVSGVLELVPAAEVRRIVAEDQATAAPEERDHRKAPRGRIHPLLVLIRIGVQAARLLKQIIGGTHPRTLNALSVAERMKREVEKAESDLKKADLEFMRTWAAAD